MYCYRITNKINNKKYIGITNNFENRIRQHQRQKTDSLIHRAIVKYGEDNFIYEIIASGLSIEEAEQLEIETIAKEKTLSPVGYNLAKGGMHGGTKNKISDEQIAYIKNHRDTPMYILYNQFSEVICYEYFKQIYRNEIRKDIVPSVEQYSHNTEFSLQFVKTKMTYEDIVEIRTAYRNLEDWKKIYPKYKDKVSESTFFDIFRGQSFKLIMPEVFSKDIKRQRYSKIFGGENSPRAKITEDDVIKIRKMYNENRQTIKQISKLYPQISYSSVFDIIHYRSWKNIQ